MESERLQMDDQTGQDVATGIEAVAAVAENVSSGPAAVQAALLARTRTGEGQYIDMALFDCALAMLANVNMNWLIGREVPPRLGNAHPNIVPYQVFRAADRDFIIACGNDSQFVALCDSIGLPDLPKDPRFTRNADRIIHREEIVAILSQHFLTDSAWSIYLQPIAFASSYVQTRTL